MTAAKLKKDSVSSAKVKDGSLLKKTSNRARFRGQTGAAGATRASGPTGPSGPTGETGETEPRFGRGLRLRPSTSVIPTSPSLRYRKEHAELDVLPSREQTRPGSLLRPRVDLADQNFSVVAESNYNNLPESDKFATGQIQHNNDFGVGCPNTTDLLVITRDASTGNLVNWFFYLTLN